MADKKESKPESSFFAFEMIALGFIAVGIIGLIIKWFNSNKSIIFNHYNTIILNLINIYARYVIFSIFLSLALFILVIVYLRREKTIKNKIMGKVIPKDGDVKIDTKNIVVENLKWKLIEDHINSDDASKWRLAILEADIMLYELLESMQLHGEGVGEKLKSVEPSDFDHLDQAWEAHKIRNAIAHEGSDFLITEKEARRVLKLYESVFKEFSII
jgi:hypothetical protein